MRRRIPFLPVPQAVAALMALALAGTLVARSVRGDELKLKDGTKITGTIVGYEDNSFKVKTSYGFAVVQKDQVVSISITGGARKPDVEKKPEPASEKSPAAAKTERKEVASETAKPATQGSNPGATAAPPISAPPATAKNVAPPVPAALAPAPDEAPQPMREEVNGNTYVNETYGFEMYKPPDWQIIAGARSVLPGAITAMGTDDQTTYLLIGQELEGKSLAADIDATDQRLQSIMDNYIPMGEKHVTISGTPAIERRFHGSVDDHNWSGTVAFVPRGDRLYTIFGMTYADNDLVQIQENVIARTIASLHFTHP